nr:MAG TPA: hypothetical protein [Caudoviricetes sp.]
MYLSNCLSLSFSLATNVSFSASIFLYFLS